MTDEQIKQMTNRFLSWKLPADFNPDNGISAERPNYGEAAVWEPIGTNLLTYAQAEAMVRHMVEGAALPADVVRLVIAAREVAYTDSPTAEERNKLDKAVEAFAERVPWDDAPPLETPHDR